MRRALLFLTTLIMLVPARAGVVINEIFYHAPNDLTDLQWVELFNPDSREVDLGGWTFSRGIRFTFPEGAKIGPKGFLVLCKSRERFREFYDIPVAGEFDKALKQGGERIELVNASGELVDSVRFDDRAPWPVGPDGLSASLERICATALGGLPANWLGSPLSTDARKPGGTPGKPNTVTAAALPPEISKVTFQPLRAEPGQPITVEADVMTDSAVKNVTLLYRVAGIGEQGEEKSVVMTDPANQHYRATVPGQDSGQIVRFRIKAEDQNGVSRLHPAEHDPRPAHSCLVFTNVTPGKIPFGFVIRTEPDSIRAPRRGRSGRGPGGFNDEEMMRFVVRMQVRALLDLHGLWSGLTLSNAPAEADTERLRAVFTEKSRAREAAEKLLASRDLQASMQRIPETVKALQDDVEKSVRPLLKDEQKSAFEAWQQRPQVGPGFGGSPAFMLRQVLPIEQAYLFLSLRTNAPTAQFGRIREALQASAQERDALMDEVRAVMEEDGDRDRLQNKIAALESKLEGRLMEILSPPEARELATWREQSRPPMMRGPGGGRGGPMAAPAPRGTAAFVYVDPQTLKPRLYDFVQVAERNGGWKIHFQKDRPLNGLPSINLIFERNERWVLAEPLAYQFYRQVGAAACLTDYVRLWIDGEPVGYHLLIEQPNKAFLRRNGLSDDGDLFKLLWYERGIVAQHEKKTNPNTGHEQLLALVEKLEQTKTNSAVQWELIRKEFDAEQVITHYAVRLLLSDWDGFFNNYFTYHDVHGTKKWSLYPWDQDQTWGDAMGGRRDSMIVALPLNYGSETARPPGSREPTPTVFRGPRGGGPGWWRPGGAFSRPMLENPIAHGHLLACLKELLTSQFTEATIFPWIDRTRDQLIDEVRLRAELSKEDPARSVARFEENLASVKAFIVERRKWLLAQDEIRKAGAFDRTALR